jgi:tellurite resistance protein
VVWIAFVESQHLSVIRVWAALAWADGVITKPEGAALRRLISGASELSESEKQQALGYLDRRVDLDTSKLGDLGNEAREGIYRAAIRLAHIDREFTETERALLRRLREGLGLDEKAAQRVEAETVGR